MNKRLKLSMALTLALAGVNAHALGLGQIEVKSALNQPLLAEIPVLTSTVNEADGLQVRLASSEALARIGLDAAALKKADLSFQVQSNAQGRKVILVTSNGRVSDPFLSFLLEVDWGKGKMLREYTVLLDPPSLMPAGGRGSTLVAPVMESAPAPAEPLQTAPARSEPSVAATGSSASRPGSPSAVDTSPAYSGDNYNVGAGDTLWSIAQQTRPDASITINQMMMALLQANPDAFAGNNINRLKKGAVLRIPGRDEALAVAAAEAAAQVRSQMQSWSGTSATFAQPADTQGSVAGSTRRSDARTATDSRLELTPPRGAGEATATQSGAASSGEGRELRAELARTREEASALAQENVELKSRVAELEALQKESRRLIELKDSELAIAQQQLNSSPAPAIEPASPVIEDPSPAEGADAPVASDSVEDTVSESVVESDEVVEEAPGADVADAVDVASEAEVVSAPAEEPPAAQPAPIESVDSSDSSSNSLMLGGGAAVLLGLLGLVALKRRKKDASSGKVGKKAVPPLAAAPAVVAGTESLEGDLIEAITHYPEDLQLHLDLLKHYFSRNDAAAFEMAAEGMFAHVKDDQEPLWLEACSLGQQISPQHPLFSTTAGLADAMAGVESALPESTANFDDEPKKVSDDPFFSWMNAAESKTATADPVEVPSDDAHTDRLTGVSSDDDQDTWQDDGAFADPVAEAVLQDDFNAFEPGAVESMTAQLSEYDNALDDPLDAIDADAATTKLDLARAYLDMGDAEGARGMLEEVLHEGNAAQRAEAQQLLDGIG